MSNAEDITATLAGLQDAVEVLWARVAELEHSVHGDPPKNLPVQHSDPAGQAARNAYHQQLDSKRFQK